MDFWDHSDWREIPQNDPTADVPTFITPHLVKHVQPNVKLILMLRQPAERYDLANKYKGRYRHLFHFCLSLFEKRRKATYIIHLLNVLKCYYYKTLQDFCLDIFLNDFMKTVHLFIRFK